MVGTQIGARVPEAAMTLRSHRRNLVVWHQSVASAGRYDAPRSTRTRRLRRRIRAVALLAVVGLMPRSSANHKRCSRLERELAGYSTPAERSDLEAILDRYPDDVTRELRDILASQAMTAYNDPSPGDRAVLRLARP
jgi:hypothetical protein